MDVDLFKGLSQSLCNSDSLVMFSNVEMGVDLFKELSQNNEVLNSVLLNE